MILVFMSIIAFSPLVVESRPFGEHAIRSKHWHFLCKWSKTVVNVQQIWPRGPRLRGTRPGRRPAAASRAHGCPQVEDTQNPFSYFLRELAAARPCDRKMCSVGSGRQRASAGPKITSGVGPYSAMEGIKLVGLYLSIYLSINITRPN